MKQYNKSIRGKLFKYFKQRLNIKKSTQGWWRCNCIYCGGKFSMGLNLQEKRSKCFICETRSSPIQLLMYLEKFDTLNQAWNFLNVQEEFEAYTEIEYKRIERKEVNLPESFKLLTGEPRDSYLGKIAFRYLVDKRNFNPTQLTLKGVGYCTSGKYNGFIIFPFYRRGKLDFFQGRKYSEAGFTKMKNPNNEEFGIGKSEIFYNEDALYIYTKINLVESITNALTLGDNTIASQGKKLSPYQLRTLISSPCKYIDILLDDDALKEAIDLALQICQYKKVKIVKMPPKKDVNDLGRKKTLILKKQVDYGTYNDFLKMKNRL